jgi:hypothetical protein
MSLHGKFISLSPRPREQLIRHVGVRESFGVWIPIQLLADLAHVTRDVDEIAKRR